MTEPIIPSENVVFPEHNASIESRRFRGFNVLIKRDELDYFQLFQDYLDDKLSTSELSSANPSNRASLVTASGRHFVIKKDGMPVTGIERKVWRSVVGPFYSTLMPKVNQAIVDGCKVIVDIFLVAEKMRGRFAEESYIIMEYAKGTSLSDIVDYTPYRKRICDAFIELHRYGLSLGDPNPCNLVLTESGEIKMFDFSVRGTQLTGRAKDRIKCRKAYGVEIPANGVLESLADEIVLLQLRKTAFFRKLRGKPFIKY